MLTPVSLGGFGMVDIKALSDSLDLRSYGRLLISEHPFLKQLATCLNHDDLFNVELNVPVDTKLKRSLELLNRDRRQLLGWPKEELLTNTNFVNVIYNAKLTSVLTPLGRRSLTYFMIQRGRRNVKIGQVTLRDLQALRNVLLYPDLTQVLMDLLTVVNRPGFVNGTMPSKELYPMRATRTLVKISSLSSKALRMNNYDTESNIICVYKQGLILTPGEVLSWTTSIKKLTSTRHKNILLRVAHGDVYSNERLCRFRLIDEPHCKNCAEPYESLNHRIIECPKAYQAWLGLNEAKIILGLKPLIDLSTESLLGAKEKLSRLELALNAELLHKLTTYGGREYNPNEIVKSVIRIIGRCEKLNPEIQQQFKEMISGN